ncbi:MAG: CHASE domain-containing protein [Pseudomonadota bacterium]|nr:CHASE domain-containing protein [Pseudomonadota bacterium]
MAIFVAVLTIAALSVYGIERNDAEQTRSQVRAAATDIGAALERRAISHVTYLRAAALLISTSARLTPQAFHELAEGMADDDENHGFAGITWAQLVPVGDIAAFEKARRDEGLTGYNVHPVPAAGRAFVVPVTYVSNKFAGNALAGNTGGWDSVSPGFDMASEPRRWAAMALAARAHRPVASDKLNLVARVAGADGSGFLIYMPVYARSAAGGRLLGYVCAPFNAQAFLAAALATVPTRSLGISLYDGAVGRDHLLAWVAGSARPDVVSSRTLLVAGRPLVLVVDARGRGSLSSLSWLTLLFGLLVAALLGLLAQVVTSNAQQDRAALDWLDEQIAIRNTLTRELNHRVKNTLANVLSIIALTRRRATGLDEFAESLTGRIMALSATHDLLTRLSWEQAPLRAVIAAELAPYTEGRDHVISIDGPEVALAPQDALSLGLALHELATNAAKYGALSMPSGQVSVKWEMMSPKLAKMVWEERGGPTVPQPQRRGFGTDLLQKIVAHELGHSVDLSFDPAGVRCALVIPVRLPAVFQMRMGQNRPQG